MALPPSARPGLTAPWRILRPQGPFKEIPKGPKAKRDRRHGGGDLFPQEGTPRSPPSKVIFRAMEGMPLGGRRGHPGFTSPFPYSRRAALFQAMVGHPVANALRHARTCIAVRLLPGPCLLVDDRPSIPEGMREAVFRPFFRLGPGGGSGLGLTLVRRVAEVRPRGSGSLGRGQVPHLPLPARRWGWDLNGSGGF
ncbi:hypothetical protein YIM73518_09150 [Thermus brockianus]